MAARQFPVERHFAARTEEDYLAAAYKMVSLCDIIIVLSVRQDGGGREERKWFGIIHCSLKIDSPANIKKHGI